MCFSSLLKCSKKGKSQRTAAPANVEMEDEAWSRREVPAAKNSSTNYARELEEVFRRFDVDGDGKITWAELGWIMSSLGQKTTLEELHQMIREVDTDGDGHITLEEFIQVNTKGVDYWVALQDIRTAFSLYDVNGDGFISCQELHEFLTKLGDSPTMDDCRRMIKAVDGDRDGLINFEDFKLMMMGSSRKVLVQ